MKKFVYIALVIIIASFVFNIISIDYQLGMLNKENLPFIIGLGSGICGFILCLIFLKFYRMKAHLSQQSKTE